MNWKEKLTRKWKEECALFIIFVGFAGAFFGAGLALVDKVIWVSLLFFLSFLVVGFLAYWFQPPEMFAVVKK